MPTGFVVFALDRVDSRICQIGGDPALDEAYGWASYSLESNLGQ